MRVILLLYAGGGCHACRQGVARERIEMAVELRPVKNAGVVDGISADSAIKAGPVAATGSYSRSRSVDVGGVS